MSAMTTEQMQAAYARIAKRDWPPLEELLRSTRRLELVIGQALRSTRHVPPELMERAIAQHRQPTKPTPPTRCPVPFDNKRAAAGERPDDS